jgi:hypothetical protein
MRAFAPPARCAPRSPIGIASRRTTTSSSSSARTTTAGRRWCSPSTRSAFRADGVLTETGAATGGGFGGGTPRSRETADLAPDYVWQIEGAAHRDRASTSKSRSRSRACATGRVMNSSGNCTCRAHRAGHRARAELGAPSRARASFLAQSGASPDCATCGAGSRSISFRRSSPMPSARACPVATRGATTRAHEIGGSARWGITSNLTLAGTANPDFSQVEADATQFAYDPRVAIFFPERRPFFLESQEQFTAPNRLIYTRRIVQPRRPPSSPASTAASTSVCSPPSTVAPPRPTGARPRCSTSCACSVMSAATAASGVVYTDKIDGARGIACSASTVASCAASSARRGNWRGSFTGGDEASESAPLWDASANITGRRFYARYAFNGISPDFDAQAGFIARPGISNLSGHASLHALRRDPAR